MQLSLRTKTLAAGALLALATLTFAFAYGSKSSAAGDTSLPASKATIAIDNLVGLSQAAQTGTTDPGAGPNTTGWKQVLSTQIKTANQKDLIFDAAFQCGIVTDTTVSSFGGTKSTSQARGTIAVRVLVDGKAAEPSTSIDATGGPYADGGVVYCDRIQTLSAKFAGLNCTADPTTGDVTCTDPETLQLILQTLNANSFNFAMPDVSSGVHRVTVEAKADASGKLIDDTAGGAMAGAEAFIGAGSLFVEEVRLINKNVAGVNPIELD